MSQQRSLTTKERPWGPEGRGGPCGALSHPPPPQRWADANKKGCCGPGSHPVTAGPALHTGHSRRLLVDTVSAAFRMGPPGPGGRTRGASHSSLTAALSLRQLQHARLSKPSVPPSPSIALHHPPSPSIALHRSYDEGRPAPPGARAPAGPSSPPTASAHTRAPALGSSPGLQPPAGPLAPALLWGCRACCPAARVLVTPP